MNAVGRETFGPLSPGRFDGLPFEQLGQLRWKFIAMNDALDEFWRGVDGNYETGRTSIVGASADLHRSAIRFVLHVFPRRNEPRNQPLNFAIQAGERLVPRLVAPGKELQTKADAG